MTLRRLAAGLVIAVATTTLSASPVSAHAELLASTPAADSVLEQSPDAIVLTFSEAVDVVDDSIRLVDSSGAAVDVGDVRRDDGPDTIAVDVGAELAGSYVVAWRVVSADAHPISGAYTFSVGEVTSTDPDLVADLLAESGDTGSSSGWLGVGRWLSYVGVAVLVGGFFVLAVCAPTLLATRRARLLLTAAGDVGAIGTAVMIGAQAAILGDGPLDPDGWVSVVESRAGRWWFVRLVLLALAPLLVVGSPPRPRPATRHRRRRGVRVGAARRRRRRGPRGHWPRRRRRVPGDARAPRRDVDLGRRGRRHRHRRRP